jgi:SSS family solute:Na+ symporter
MLFKYIASPINAGAIAMVTGLVIVPVVSVITPKMDKNIVNKMFECYEEKVLVAKKRALETE